MFKFYTEKRPEREAEISAIIGNVTVKSIGEISIEGQTWPYLVTTVIPGDSFQESFEHLTPIDLSHIASTLGNHGNEYSVKVRENGQVNSWN